MDLKQKEVLLREYTDNNSKKLNSISNQFLRKFHSLNQMDYDDFYSIANEQLWMAVEEYDDSKGASFKTFLSMKIYGKFKTEMTRRRRKKRIGEDEDNPIVTLSLDTPIGQDENSTLSEIIASDFNIEKEVSDEIGISNDENVEKYLNSLPQKAKEILLMKMDGVLVDEIKNKLDITDTEYWKYIKATKYNENINLFTKRDVGYEEDNAVCEIMKIDTTDSYRMDKYSLYNLLDDKRKGKINCKYILQRKPYQWSNRQVNKFLSRVLNNQPVPEIIICEQNLKSKKRAYLIDGLQRLSYSELFACDGITVGKDGAEFTNIHYRDYQVDKNGEPIVDEEGDIKYEVKVFDIIGKKFSEFPEFLKDRFHKFNVNVTTFFDCTDEQIAYHIRNYNNHEGMTNNQYEITNISTDVVRGIKDISQNHPFFKDDYGKYTDKNKTKGIIDRVISESIMTTYFSDDWKKKVEDTYDFINNNVKDYMFVGLKENLDRLCKIVNKEVQDLFNVTNSPVWFAVFNKFKEYNLPDDRFFEFMKEFKSIISESTYEDGSFEVTYRSRNTKDKKIVIAKINGLEKLMLDFLHIKEDVVSDHIECPENLQDYVSEFKDSTIISVFNMETDIEINKAAMDTLDLVKNNINTDDPLEDIKLYLDILNDWTLEVNNNTKLICKENLPSLVGVVGYSCVKDIDEEALHWFTNFVEKQDSCILNQKENYLHMIQSLNTYIKESEKKSA